jgi:ATP-dependent DNA ligase
MEARSADQLPQGEGWSFEPKWDGFRCVAFRDGPDVALQAKSGKSLTRFFPEVAATLGALPFDRFVIDGELMIASGAAFSFDALQMRLHSAESRIRKLSIETPASLVLFDMLVDAGGEDLSGRPLAQRRLALDSFIQAAGQPMLQLSPSTTDAAQARAWLASTGATLDGVVAKRVDAAYAPGERAMIKVKRLRTADCVVGGFRYGEHDRLVGSLLLGLYDGPLLHHVGFTSGLKDAERPALTQRLEALIEPPGFTGRAPGGPSRWATERSAEWRPLRPELVVEVRFDHVTGDRFRHGTRLLRWRPDKAPRQCTFDQLRQ